MYETALRHYQAGRLAEAGAACSAILNRTPRDFRALRLLGLIYSKRGAFGEAAFFLTAALGSGAPDQEQEAAALNDLAMAELSQGHGDAAIDCFERSLALRPGDAGMLLHYGNALHNAGRIDQAIAAYRSGLIAQPDDAGLHANLGNALRSAGLLEEAVDSYRRAIAAQPDLVRAHNDLGRTLCLLDRPADALECHQRAVALQPDDAGSRVDLANTLRMLQRFEAAEEQYRAALRLRPDDALALLGLGIALTANDRPDEAVSCLERAVAISPGYGAARMALGNALIALNRHPEAMLQYKAARATLAETRDLDNNEAIALLATGMWPEGWERLEVRFAIANIFTADFPLDAAPFWRGEPGVEGKTILLQAEQGYGDTLQFVRYVPMVAARGARVVLRVPSRLVRLLADTPGADEVIGAHRPVPDCDLLCPLMSLPAAFGTTLFTVPANVPYVRTPPEFRLLWQALLGPRTRPRIGIAWYGRQNLAFRSMKLATLAPLLRRTDVEFHSLQLDMPEADREWLAANPGLIDHEPEQKDFADAAGLVEQMDLVVTIDTSLAHLAGAMARPVWIMLPFSGDWRWLLERDDTPWYPTARLFRQKRRGDWDGVVAEVVQALGDAAVGEVGA